MHSTNCLHTNQTSLLPNPKNIYKRVATKQYWKNVENSAFFTPGIWKNMETKFRYGIFRDLELKYGKK